MALQPCSPDSSQGHELTNAAHESTSKALVRFRALIQRPVVKQGWWQHKVPPQTIGREGKLMTFGLGQRLGHERRESIARLCLAYHMYLALRVFPFNLKPRLTRPLALELNCVLWDKLKAFAKVTAKVWLGRKKTRWAKTQSLHWMQLHFFSIFVSFFHVYPQVWLLSCQPWTDRQRKRKP